MFSCLVSVAGIVSSRLRYIEIIFCGRKRYTCLEFNMVRPNRYCPCTLLNFFVLLFSMIVYEVVWMGETVVDTFKEMMLTLSF